MWGTLVVLVFLSAGCSAAKFPSTWKPCKMGKGHNECLKQSIQQTIPDLVKGLPKLGVMPIDPLMFSRIAIDQKDRPVSLNLIFTNMAIEGLRNAKVESAKNDWKVMQINVSSPVVTAKSKYKANGKVLVLPIQGDGDCTLVLDKFTSVVTIKFNEIQSNGKAYYKVNDVDVILDTEKMSINLENLFNGNKQLGDQMNIFLNENWREIFVELKPGVEAALRQAGTDMATKFFAKVPKNEVTPS